MLSHQHHCRTQFVLEQVSFAPGSRRKAGKGWSWDQGQWYMPNTIPIQARSANMDQFGNFADVGPSRPDDGFSNSPTLRRPLACKIPLWDTVLGGPTVYGEILLGSGCPASILGTLLWEQAPLCTKIKVSPL